MRLKFTLIIFFLLLAGASLVLAEQFPFQAGPVYTHLPQIGDSEKVVVVVELPPGVTPEPSDFRIIVDDKTVATGEALKPFRQSGQGLALLVCVDVSGSMKGEPLKDAKEALLSFIGGARSKDQIALVSFADHRRTDSSFGKPRQHLEQAVLGLKTRGQYTRLNQTLYDSLDAFEGAEIPQRKRIIVISDGLDEGSKTSVRNVIDKSKAARIPIDIVGRGKIKDQVTEGLRGLANGTGGRFVHARPDQLALGDALNRIYRDLLETRSLVIYFKYEMDDTGRTTQNALIELKRAGEAPLSVRIPDKIPLPRPAPEIPSKPDPQDKKVPSGGIPPPSFIEKYWPLFLMVVILGASLFIWVRYRTAKKTIEDQEPEEPVAIKEPEEQPLDTLKKQDLPPEPKPRPPKRTQVGGHYFPAPEPGQPTAVLTGMSGPVEGRQFAIEKERFHIGASQENDLIISEDDFVSGQHAYIQWQAGNIFIYDIGSLNQTFVNQTQVTDAGFLLNPGDHISIGTSTLEVAPVSA